MRTSEPVSAMEDALTPLWNLLTEPKELVLVEAVGHKPPAEVVNTTIDRFLYETLGPVRRWAGAFPRPLEKWRANCTPWLRISRGSEGVEMPSGRKYRCSGNVAALAGLALFCGACEPGQGDERAGEAASLQGAEAALAAVDPATLQRATAMLEEELARIESQLDSLPGLILSVRRTLRRHLNEDHVARARALGVPLPDDTAAIERLVAAGELVRIPDSTRHWVVRELDQSLPYVTPEKNRVLEQLGDRFHARLSDAGLPPFRFEISSALRTGELQRVLRTRNTNASATRSSHEFGTTVDIAYNEFSPPSEAEWARWRDAVPGGDESSKLLRRRLAGIAEARLDSLGDAYSDHLKGELGAVLSEMQAEGRLWPLYERSQPVFHTTLASRRPAGD